LAFPRLHKTFITDRGRPYTDTPFVIPPGILKSSQPIGDDPNLRMALNLTYNFVRYSLSIYIFVCTLEYKKIQPFIWSFPHLAGFVALFCQLSLLQPLTPGRLGAVGHIAGFDHHGLPRLLSDSLQSRRSVEWPL
jgi:hypothetical protein